MRTRPILLALFLAVFTSCEPAIPESESAVPCVQLQVCDPVAEVDGQVLFDCALVCDR